MDSDTASSALKLSDWIDAESIQFLPPEQNDKDTVIRTLVEKLCAARNIEDAENLVTQVLERESGISTTLDTGLSIPHARVKGHSGFNCILGVIPHGLRDASGIDIRAMLVFFSPSTEEFFSAHLKFLRYVSTLFQPAVIEALVSSASPDAAAEALKAAESAA